MTNDQAKEIAWGVIVVAMPSSWIEYTPTTPVGRVASQPRSSPKAIKLRDRIADAILKAYRLGQQHGVEKKS